MKTLHPDDVSRVAQRIKESRATGGPYEAEYRVRRASDGNYRWHLARSMPMKDKDGKVIGWFGSATDIDDQKRAEEALRESEERFRKIFEEGPLGILLVGTDGRIQRANRSFREMLGYSESEMIALGVAGIAHPEDWERDYPFVSRLWRGEISHYQVERRYLRKDGQVIWGHLTVSLMRDEAGKPMDAIGMIEDITERKRAEENLQNSERTLRTLMDASPESILLLDTGGIVLFANETAAQRIGATVDKILGSKPGDRLPPELAVQRMEHLQEVVRTGKAVRFEDERAGRYYEIAMHPVCDEQGKVAAVAVLSIDRTERKRAEAALQEAHDELERRVEERTAELLKANEDLRQGERRFRNYFEQGLLGMAVSSADRRWLEVNDRLCEIRGYSREELLAMKWEELTHPDDWDAELPFVQPAYCR